MKLKSTNRDDIFIEEYFQKKCEDSSSDEWGARDWFLHGVKLGKVIQFIGIDDISPSEEAKHQAATDHSQMLGELPENYKQITINKAQCLLCNDILESKSKEDYITCRCGNLSIGGGKDHLKRNAIKVNAWIELSE